MSEDMHCETCHGTGRHVYSDSGMGGGPGGQTLTEGPCPGTTRAARSSNCPFVLSQREVSPSVEH